MPGQRRRVSTLPLQLESLAPVCARGCAVAAYPRALVLTTLRSAQPSSPPLPSLPLLQLMQASPPPPPALCTQPATLASTAAPSGTGLTANLVFNVTSASSWPVALSALSVQLGAAPATVTVSVAAGPATGAVINASASWTAVGTATASATGTFAVPLTASAATIVGAGQTMGVLVTATTAAGAAAMQRTVPGTVVGAPAFNNSVLTVGNGFSIALFTTGGATVRGFLGSLTYTLVCRVRAHPVDDP